MSKNIINQLISSKEGSTADNDLETKQPFLTFNSNSLATTATLVDMMVMEEQKQSVPFVEHPYFAPILRFALYTKKIF